MDAQRRRHRDRRHGAAEAAMVLTEMDPDDAVDILGHFDQPHREALLDEMGAAEAADVRTSAQFPPDTAGGIMTTDFTGPAAGPDGTAGDR
jgi:magnesium transporter